MPTRRRTFISVTVLAGLSFGSLASRARADEPESGDARGQADADFNEGKRLMDAGQTAAACAKFAHSQELDPKLGRLLNLAFCHEQEGKTASAWSEYNGAAALAEQKGQGERVDFAREHAAAVAKKLAFVHLDVPANATAVEVDGTGLSRDRWATPVPFDPGEHRVVASAPGKRVLTATFVVGTTPGIHEFRIAPLQDDTVAPLAIPPISAPPPLPAPSEPPPEPSGPNLVPAVIMTGVSVAAFAVGGVFGIMAMSKKSSADKDCPDKVCNAQGTGLISQAQTSATVSTIGFGVGLAGAAAATWLFIKPPGSTKAGETATARWTPIVGARFSGLALEGSW